MSKKQPGTGPHEGPVLQGDGKAGIYLMQTLPDRDLSRAERRHFEFEKKETQVNMRVPRPLLEAVKHRARARGMPYTRYIRMLMEQDVADR
jgi:predicted DNA binding CopG/RHH family protein